ncbi:MAG: maltose alpha-D-glucosyltransferase [Actinomycetaceae bacterium]
MTAPVIPQLPDGERSGARPGLSHDPEWYRSAVFYEVYIKTFADTSGSGVGDIQGLISRLDYLQWLGVDCLWIPPFYPSPQRDGGYDVADYTAVDPQYGSLDDLDQLVEEAHSRGIRIVIDVVANHTSDAHPWFQASRNQPDGPYGDFYVWSDSNEGYNDARIIFVDTEESNWTFDPVRRQYFWHRFFSHQPDLNYENPAVKVAILDVVRFWARRGIDGFRLDAVPYLFEEEGTSCENLPATHEFLAELRAMVDAEFPGTVLVAEANQWPDDVVDYYGTPEAPECHICFHFPVMPRIFYSLRDQRASAIRDILAATPQIPSGAQWGTFLRNHDELTLEMVTTEERAAMYGWYAEDPRMRANVGIRRRLAPLLGHSRAEMELANSLLLSLPGSPWLYYGDEIGMGDNIWLPDRDGVRTPMQWTPDRNAGFSTAQDPGRLYLPVVQSLVSTYTAVNVESQLAQPTSLLHWVRGMLEVRRRYPVFGDGDFVPRDVDNEAVLAYTRGNLDSVVLCLANLANTARSARVEVPEHARWQATDVFGGARFPAIGEDGTLEITLGSRDFYWLELTRPGTGAPAPLEGRTDEAQHADFQGPPTVATGPSYPGSSERTVPSTPPMPTRRPTTGMFPGLADGVAAGPTPPLPDERGEMSPVEEAVADRDAAEAATDHESGPDGGPGSGDVSGSVDDSGPGDGTGSVDGSGPGDTPQTASAPVPPSDPKDPKDS